MIGKQNRDALYFCCIFEDSSVSHIVYKKTQLGGGGVGGGGKGWVERDQFKSIQVRTAGGRAMECEYIRSLTTFPLFFFCFLFFFCLEVCRFYKHLRVKIYTNKFQGLYRCCIRLQVFITFYQSNSELWESFNFIQPQTMAMLALNFRFVLDFDNSRIGVQCCNHCAK